MVANWVTNYCDVCIIYFAGEFKSWGISQGDLNNNRAKYVENSSNSAPYCCHSQTESIALCSPRSLLSWFVQPYVQQVRDTEARAGQQHPHQSPSISGRSMYKRVFTYIIDCSLICPFLSLLVSVDIYCHIYTVQCECWHRRSSAL